MQSLRVRSTPASSIKRSFVAPQVARPRVARPVPVIRFQGDKHAAPSAPAVEQKQQEEEQQHEAPPKPKFNHAYLIFNPAAGQENPAAILGDISLILSQGMKLTILQTQKEGPSPPELAKQALKQGADVVLVSGGDGTVGAVAGALVDTGVPMGIIPRGTANAFSVALGIPTHLDDPINFAKQAADVILQGYTVDVDTALVDTSDVKDYPMILLMGIGYEAETVSQADRGLKDALGPLAYVVSGVKSLASAGNFKAHVTVDGEHADGEVAAITIANAAPPTSVLAHGHTGDCIYDDGKLEAIGYVAAEGNSVTAPIKNAVSMVRLFTGIMFSDQPVQDEERIFGGRYKDIQVECDPPQKVVLDGELLGTTPVRARVKPASLKVIIPPPQVTEDAPAGEEEGETVNEEGNGAASQPDGGSASTMVQASAQVEDKPIVAHEPNSKKQEK